MDNSILMLGLVLGGIFGWEIGFYAIRIIDKTTDRITDKIKKKRGDE